MGKNLKIWVKSYPFPREVKSLSDLGRKEIGMELFLGEDWKANEECLNISRNEFPEIGIELFCYRGEERRERDVIWDPISPNPELRRQSRYYLFKAMEAASRYGAKHLQMDGGDGFRWRPGQEIGRYKEKLLQQKRDLIAELGAGFPNVRVLFENTFAVDDNSVVPIFSCVGHNLSDFTVGEGLPLEYDIAHHAVAFDTYSRASQFGFPLNEREKYLARRVREVGLTDALLGELQTIPQIYFSQFSNPKRFTLLGQKPIDESYLLELNRVLPLLIERSENINPEVGDTDFEKRPYLRSCVAALQEGNTEYFK